MFVVEQIHRTATAAPRRLAMVFNGAPLTYGTFWRFIDGARRRLQPLLPEQGIAVLWVDSLLESWILQLALRSLGLDTAVVQSVDQVALFRTADVACVITLASEAARAVDPAWGMRQLTAGAPSTQPVSIDDPLPPAPAFPYPGVAILRTSGTTGQYKNVRNVLGADRAAIERRLTRYAVMGDDVAPLSETSVLNVFDMGPWTGGGGNWPLTVWALGGAVVFEQGRRFDRALAWPGVTHTFATPWYLQQLLSLPEGAFSYSSAMQVIVTADALSPAMARDVARRLTPRIMLLVGSTEIGPWAWSALRSDDDLRWHRPYPDRRLEVVDDADVRVATGDLGRVRVELGPDDSGSYMSDPETSASFFRDGWFYPGDLGMLDSQGRVSLQGRASDVVNIDGQKLPVEPWESAIRAKLDCIAVCVLGGDWPAKDHLHVFVQTDAPIPPLALHEAVRTTMVGFRDVQAHVVESLPRTETGKVKRLALAQLLRNGAFDQAPASGA